MDPRFISEIRSMTAEHKETRQILVTRSRYDPSFCKTCQRIGLAEPRAARVIYSDCEEHFRRRVARLFHSGVRVISKDCNIDDLFHS
jgi:hypothetical protein